MKEADKRAHKVFSNPNNEGGNEKRVTEEKGGGRGGGGRGGGGRRPPPPPPPEKSSPPPSLRSAVHVTRKFSILFPLPFSPSFQDFFSSTSYEFSVSTTWCGTGEKKKVGTVLYSTVELQYTSSNASASSAQKSWQRLSAKAEADYRQKKTMLY